MKANMLEKLVDYYHENKLSHAYLLETNNLEKCFNDLKEIVKKIFCQEIYSKECNKCNICNLIDQGYLPSFIVIEPDGSTIKKEQVLNLKKAFSSVPIYTKENIYVIKQSEKLTSSSANTMLKFLEEPEENILGFFITNNINNVIATIKSRAEIIRVYYDEADLNLESLTLPENEQYMSVVENYLYSLEVEKKKSIMYNKDVLLSVFKEREDIKKIFNIILIIYNNVLCKKIGQETKIDSNKWIYIFDLTNEELIKRINLITKVLEDIESNVNIDLLVDKFVIELSDLNG